MFTSVRLLRRPRSLRAATGVAPLVLVALLVGCASKPGVTHSGFLSDYSRLAPVDESRLRFESPASNRYHGFIVDPVRMLVSTDVLDQEEQAEARLHFEDAFERAIIGAGFPIADQPGEGVARVRLALTDVAGSTWWKKVHPVSRAIGAGTGGAAMEAEVVDSVTGEQIAAVIQAGSGNQFAITNFSTLADVKSAIDGWARVAAERLEEISAASGR